MATKKPKAAADVTDTPAADTAKKTKKPGKAKKAASLIPNGAPATLKPGNVKAAIAAAGARGNGIYVGPIDNLHVHPNFNSRIRSPQYLAHIAHLKELIRAHGFKREQPLKTFVYLDPEDNVSKLAIVGGHSRYEAAQELRAEGAEVPGGLEELPFITMPAGTTMRELHIARELDNIQRGATPLEMALDIHNRLNPLPDEIEDGIEPMTDEEVCKAYNITTRYLLDLKNLAEAPRDLQDLIANETVSATLVIDELRKADPEKLLAKLLAAAEAKAAAGDKAGKKVTKKDLKKDLKAEGEPKPRGQTLDPVTDEDRLTLSSLEVEEDMAASGFVLTVDLTAKLRKFADLLLERVSVDIVDAEVDPAADL